MGINKKYVVAVALLAVLAVVFGLAGTVARVSETFSPQPSSDAVTHFVNPPTYDSGWVDIEDKRGLHFNITHDLNTTEALVDVVGRQSLTDGDHKLFFGSTFHTQWNKTYGGTDNEFAESIVQTHDGGFALAGDIDSGAEGYDFWLVKTDSDGTMQWNKTYGGTNDDQAHSLVQANDGGYAIGGYTDSFGAGDYDFWLVKTDSDGIMQWNKTYGGTGNENAWSVVHTSDGGYAVAGATYSFGAGTQDFWLVKTDSDGTMQWNKTYGGTNRESARSLVQTSDEGYALAGITNSFGAGANDVWLVKTDWAGDMEWSRTYGEADYDGIEGGLVGTPDGGYAIAGYTESYGRDGLAWLIKTDWAGDMEWSRTYGGDGYDGAWSVVQTVNGEYAMICWTSSFGSGGYDAWLIVTDINTGSKGLTWNGLTNKTASFYRGIADPYWNYIRVRIWTIREPTWQFGDINQDGAVDAEDLYIVSRNYGKSFSALSLTGIIGVTGVYAYKKRKKQPA